MISIVSKFLIQLIQKDFQMKDASWQCENYECLVRTFLIVAVSIVVLPLSLKTNFYAFRHVTIFGIGAIFYSIFVVFYESFQESKEATIDIGVQYTHFDWNLFSGYTSALFSFTCYSVVFPIRMELSNPVEKRIKKVFLFIIKSIYKFLDFRPFSYGGIHPLFNSSFKWIFDNL